MYLHLHFLISWLEKKTRRIWMTFTLSKCHIFLTEKKRRLNIFLFFLNIFDKALKPNSFILGLKHIPWLLWTMDNFRVYYMDN